VVRLEEEEIKQTLHLYANTAMYLLKDAFNLSNPVFKEKSDVPEIVQFVLTSLYSSCYSTSESALLLISYRRLWDLEILKRTILEGTTKLLFIILGSEEDMIQKSYEFYYVIPELKQLNNHNKAMACLTKNEGIAHKSPEIKSHILTEEKVIELEGKYPKNLRKILNQKWSFSEMIRTLEKEEPEYTSSITATYYKYSLGSHFVHQDGNGLIRMWDRRELEMPKRNELELVQGVSGIFDILYLAIVRLELYFGIHHLDTSPIDELDKKISEFQSIINS
jgi:hypothetical protein